MRTVRLSTLALILFVIGSGPGFLLGCAASGPVYPGLSKELAEGLAEHPPSRYIEQGSSDEELSRGVAAYRWKADQTGRKGDLAIAGIGLTLSGTAGLAYLASHPDI